MTNHELIEIHLNNSDLNLADLTAISKLTEAEVLVVLKDSHSIEILKAQVKSKKMTSDEYDEYRRDWMNKYTSD